MKIIGIFFILLFGIIFLASCSKENRKNELIVFNAGSLSLPLKKIAKEFENENPGTHIILESAGSLMCARKIIDLHRDCDVFLSADYNVIDQLLIPKYASWDIQFASNEIVIAYHKNSKYAKEINANNWTSVLLKPGVSIGASNPNNDPCGYQTLLMLKLASIYYGDKNLYLDMMTQSTHHHVETRPKETDLVALLETDTIDYFFIYISVAKECGFEYIKLPGEINLGEMKYNNYYNQVEVTISGSKPGTITVKKGEPIIYGLTILKNAKNPELALKFVDFILSKNKGMQFFEKNGLSSLVPSSTPSYNSIPEELKKYANNNNI